MPAAIPAKTRATTIRNTPEETFVGLLLLLVGVVGLCLALLMLSARYPNDFASVTLLLGSAAVAAGSAHYLRRSRGTLHLSAAAITYQPCAGRARRYPWGSVARVSVVPGWVWLHDRRGRALVSYALGPAKLRTVSALMARYGRKRPRTWPRLDPRARARGVDRLRTALDPRALLDTLQPLLPLHAAALDRALGRVVACARLAFSPAARGR